MRLATASDIEGLPSGRFYFVSHGDIVTGKQSVIFEPSEKAIPGFVLAAARFLEESGLLGNFDFCTQAEVIRTACENGFAHALNEMGLGFVSSGQKGIASLPAAEPGVNA